MGAQDETVPSNKGVVKAKDGSLFSAFDIFKRLEGRCDGAGFDVRYDFFFFLKKIIIIRFLRRAKKIRGNTLRSMVTMGSALLDHGPAKTFFAIISAALLFGVSCASPIFSSSSNTLPSPQTFELPSLSNDTLLTPPVSFSSPTNLTLDSSGGNRFKP